MNPFEEPPGHDELDRAARDQLEHARRVRQVNEIVGLLEALPVSIAVSLLKAVVVAADAHGGNWGNLVAVTAARALKRRRGPEA